MDTKYIVDDIYRTIKHMKKESAVGNVISQQKYDYLETVIGKLAERIEKDTPTP